jgi:hypothetical protein
MDSSIFPLWFLGGMVLPIAGGFGLSFWLVGRGNRLLWIVPSILIWLGVQFIVAKLAGPKFSLLTLSSHWVFVLFALPAAWGLRRLRKRS